MTELLERVTVNPEQCGGRPCIRGMRIRVVDLLDLLAAGLNAELILDEHGIRNVNPKAGEPTFFAPAE